MLCRFDINLIKMKRQYLLTPVCRENYDELYYAMSPVPPMYWTEPGNPPTLPGHVEFDDNDYNFRRRACRRLLKGRYAGGSIAYVSQEDLEVFACLYQKEISEYTSVQAELMELLNHEGPMNIGLMKDLTGLLVKEITPALHRLQEAFLIYEDQMDNEGDRGWYLFESEFPEVDLHRYSKVQALKKVLPRVAKLLVFFDEELLKSYYRLPMKLIKEAVSELTYEGTIVGCKVDGKDGYLLREDQISNKTEVFNLLEFQGEISALSTVILLQRNDFLVRAYADHLKEAYPSQWDALYYILIDGEFHGVVVGKFKFGPHLIEDIILDLSEEEKGRRREEILEAVYTVFDRENSPVKRYNGKVLER